MLRLIDCSLAETYLSLSTGVVITVSKALGSRIPRKPSKLLDRYMSVAFVQVYMTVHCDSYCDGVHGYRILYSVIL